MHNPGSARNPCRLVGENGSHEVCKQSQHAQFSSRIDVGVRTSVVDLAGAGVYGLEELVHLLLGHLLAQVGQDVLDLADADETRHVLVEHLEATAVFLGLAGIAEAAGAVQDALEGLEIDCATAKSAAALHPNNSSGIAGGLLTVTSDILLEVLDLGEGGVLAAGAEQVAEAFEGDTAVATLVEQGESLLVVGRSLGVNVVRSHGCKWSGQSLASAKGERF